jgi:hypothetical protein
MDTLRHDLIHAFRSVRKNPAYTVVTIMTLALGIGANSAIFSVVNGIHMALGASRTTVLRMVLGQGLKFTVTGLVVGVAAAFGLTRLLQAQLFNVKPTEPGDHRLGGRVHRLRRNGGLPDPGQQGGEGGSDGGSQGRMTFNLPTPNFQRFYPILRTVCLGR